MGRRAAVRLAGLTALLCLGAVLAPGPGLAAARPAPPRGALLDAELVQGGLAFPAAFTFDPSGRIFYAERFSGEIRILDLGAATDTLFATVPDLLTEGERGLLGIALHSAYPAKPWVYVYATRSVGGVARNQILRYRDRNGTGTRRIPIFTADTVAAHVHNGGRILFSPGGRLFAVIGDGASAANSQLLTNTAGKVLRMDGSGNALPGNPFGNLIWAYGIRNSFGMAVDPENGLLWETENGPACNDELNLVLNGRNYGWGPSQTCTTPPDPPQNTNQDGPDPVLPKAYFTPTVAPTGAAFCDGCGLDPDSEGRMFFGLFNPDQIQRATLTPNRRGIASIVTAYSHSSGILGVERGTDGALYFSDAAGIYRLVPPG